LGIIDRGALSPSEQELSDISLERMTPKDRMVMNPRVNIELFGTEILKTSYF
jgi:hypothetical protein